MKKNPFAQLLKMSEFKMRIIKDKKKYNRKKIKKIFK